MSKFTLKKQQCGATLKLNLCFMRGYGDNIDISSDAININNLGLLIIKCKHKSNSDIQLSVSLKKNENAKIGTIKIICEEFVKQFYLSDEWLESLVRIKSYDSYLPLHNGSKICHYNMEVIITVDEEITTPLLVNTHLYEDQESTDFQLQTADGTVAVHKAVLFIHSDMFRTMLSGKWKETGEGRIKIEGVTVQTLQHLKEYMYLATLPDEGLEPLLLIAARYLMEKLKADCITKLVKTIKPEDFDNIVQFAFTNNIVELGRALILEIPDDVVNNVRQLKNSINIEKVDKK